MFNCCAVVRNLVHIHPGLYPALFKFNPARRFTLAGGRYTVAWTKNGGKIKLKVNF